MAAPTQQVLALASQALRAGDPDGADHALAPLLARSAADPRVSHMAGLVRMHQQRFEEAARFFAQARKADPREAMLAFSHGTALRWLERHAEAVEAFKDAVARKSDYAEAYFEAATALQLLGRQDEAETILRQWVAAMPDNARGKLALADLLLTTKRPSEAEPVLRASLQHSAPQELRGLLHRSLGLSLHRQGKDEEALEHFEKSVALNPDPMTDAMRIEVLQRLKRYDQAAALSAGLIVREPENHAWHKLHNDLMYRLKDADYLKSYDRAPKTVALLMSKAYFLTHERRAEEALQTYREALTLEPDNWSAAAGEASSLSMMKRHAEALGRLEGLLARHGDTPDLLLSAAEAAIALGDAEKAAALTQRSVALAPYDQLALAIQGTAWRMLGDERDETLNGYDSLIKIYDLDPPDGFSDMESFNAELNAWLDHMHPTTREYLDQSLRHGSQTPDRLFGHGHELVQRLERRLHQTITRYIADMREDDRHPFLSRRARAFDYTGSWSSRLRDCGFHTNHIHPEGWISSCYYVALPDAVEDAETRQGWIKFGEPSLDVALKDPIRRAIQPRPGRLVLFPSYMWHGTIPFRDSQPRTTIAFDVVPVS
jgi:tetratricopeptide (TPR) repeat protein